MKLKEKNNNNNNNNNKTIAKTQSKDHRDTEK